MTQRAPSRKRAAYDPVRSRSKILRAAEGLFVRQTFESTTIRQIASRANVPSSLLYYYYGNKEGLFAAVQRNLYKNVVEAMSSLKLAHPPTRDGVAEFLGQFFDVVSRHPNLFRLNPTPAMLRDPAIREAEYGTMRLLIGGGEAYLRDGIDAGVFRPVDPRALMLAFHAIIRTIFVDQDFNYVLYGRKMPSPKVLAPLRATVVDMAVRTLFPDPPTANGNRSGRS